MPANKVLPGGRFAPLRHRPDAVPAQDVAHGLVRYLVAQVGQGTDDAVITPTRVLASVANHQRFHFGLDPGSAGRAALFAAVEFFSHQCAIPGKNGIGFGNARDLLQSFAS